MALYARNVTQNWGTADSWSTTGSGGAGDGSVPGSGDDVIFDSGYTGTITIAAAASCKSLVVQAGSTGTLSHGAYNLGISGQDGSGNALLLVSGFNYSSSSVDTARITFSGTGTNKITTAGAILPNITFFNAGDTFQLQDDLSVNGTSSGDGTIYFREGIFDPNGKTVTLTGASSKFLKTSMAISFYNLTITGAASKSASLVLASADFTVTNTLTLAGNSSTNRLLIYSSSLGTQRNITLTGATISLSNVDFRDIHFDDPDTDPYDASAITGGSGNCGGNSGITFTTADDWYWYNSGAGTYNLSDYSHWYEENAHTNQMASTRTILPQDTCYINADSVNGSTTIDQDLPRIPGINMSAVDAVAFHTNNINQEIYGSFTKTSNVTFTTGTYSFTFAGRGGAYTNNYSGNATFNINTINGSVTQIDNLSTSNNGISLNYGTFDADTYNINAYSFNSSNSNERTLLMGSGTWTLTGATSSTVWNTGTTTGFTSTDVGETSTIVGSSNSRTHTYSMGGLTYNNLSFTGTGSTLTISGNNTFNTLTISAPNTVKFTAGTTTTVNSLSATGSVGNTITLASTSAGSNWQITDADGGTNVNDYLAVTDSHGHPDSTFYYGANGSGDAYSQANGWAASAGGGGGFPDAIGAGVMVTGKYWW